MKKLLVLLGLIILFPIETSAFDIVNFINPFSKTQTVQTNNATVDVTTALESLLNQAQPIDTSVQNTFLSMVSKLSTQQESAIIQSKLNSIWNNQKTTQTEKSELISQLMAAYASDLTNNKTNIASIISNMSTTERKSLALDISQMAQYAQQYTALAKQGAATATNLIKVSKKASEAISVIKQINTAASAFKTRAATVVNMANQVRTIAKYAGFGL